ncbi:hypothetical protein KFL_003140130 [Klebsormidium nitens]|uniref:Uncharacterized protein n=1 Tax=Klebsormidium nitens TaxID=105231 RepID=A0A1Y1I799_KLENI|nr:hypothetical protein KFL_003140130 [Klebsormidium nitens]|eukprot:GAQ86834.1 hypothetical protein KFL_003140130 [Klebsormidium nitens]
MAWHRHSTASLPAVKGRQRALRSSRRTSGWVPRQNFFDLVHGENKASFLNTIAWAAELYYRTAGIRASDFQFLFQLVKFLEDYAGVPKEATQDARIEINLREKCKREDSTWAQFNRTCREHNKIGFFHKRRPDLRAQGVPPEDEEDVLETEWAEFEAQQAAVRARFVRTGEHIPDPVSPPGVSEILDTSARANDSIQIVVPKVSVLSRAEKAAVRLVRDRVLSGREISWHEFESRQPASRYPNRLSKPQILARGSEAPVDASS